MDDVNKHEIVGTVVGEPKFSEKSVARLTFKVKTVRKWKQGEEERESVKTHNVVCWRDVVLDNKERIKPGVRVTLMGPVVTNVKEEGEAKTYFTETQADELSVVMD